jgi:predicted phage terminase large subunit-like protein
MYPHARTVDHEAERLKLELRLALLEGQEQAQNTFIGFSRYVWPEAIISSHHEIMADAFDRIAAGTLKRLIVNMPPRHTKSEFASYLLPAYLMGRKPATKIIQATHTGELAVRFGRKVRNLMDLDRYKEVFSGVALKADSKAAGRWDTDAGGEYFAVGVGGAMTGRGADMLIIDDPHSEQDAQSALALENAWEWYTSGPRTRLQPGGAIVIVMCMTGDTPVLMADGVEKPLSELRRGDMVATFDKGRLRTAKVNNWKSSGVDTIYKIRTQSGKILRANARHPFLVMNEGVLEWTRLTQLSVGDELVSLKDAIDPRVLKQSPVSVAPAKPQIATIGKTQTLRDAKLVTTVSGRAKRALQKIAAIPSVVVACVPSITIKSISHLNRQKQPATTGLKAGTALLLSSMTQWCSNAVTDVMSVVSRLQSEIHALTGTGSCVLTTATTQGEYEGYSATTVTSQLGTERRPLYLNELHRISDFTTDPIASITPDGNEEVFDVEIDRTENFIANGVVSHNTRWGTKDLTARLLKAQSTNNADQWEVIEFPAVFDEGEENERALWPSFWKLEELRAVRASMSLQKWNAMYQQKPTADEGAILKREWWKLWEHDHLPDVEYIIQSYDTAYSKKETADYSVITTWGVFFPTEDSGPNIMLMDVRKGRWDFPDLKRQAKEQYDYWQPDNVLIEAKATGTTLQQELRRMGIPVTMYSPGGRRAGQDKVSRANSVAPILESGMVWATDDDWAQDLIEECAAFPNGDNDDQVDSTTQALTRFRAGNFISLHTDQDDEPRTEGLVPEYY